MNDFLFELLKLIIMALALILTRYIVPWLKEQVDAQKMQTIALWAEKAVLSAQQTLQASSTAERKAVVTKFLREILTAKKIAISDEQLNILIESAVKQMKIDEKKE